MTSKEDLMQQYRQMIEALQTENKNLKQRLEWYDNFVDYVMQYDNNVYNSACEYADELEKNDENEKAD
jgi:predicted RNase H-like nuclease (RuvC/YqgF family)